MLNERRSQAELLKEAEEGWCDRRGTLQEVKAKIQMRQEGAFRRERALAYGLAQKQWKSNQGLDSRTNASLTSLKSQQFDKNSWGWSWLERWMSAKPWENRLMEQGQNDPSETTPQSKINPDNHKLTELEIIRTRDGQSETKQHDHQNLGKTASNRWPTDSFIVQPKFRVPIRRQLGSSSLCTSTTTPISMERTEETTAHSSNSSKPPSYMNLTQSTKAKQRNPSPRIYRQSMDDFQFLKNSGVFMQR
ncbi:hypothetical protein OSB04_010536 [Centaurea solstitialis]|uniref:Uncharacterized protein n=1 Tax=Centaurea solstitialis TaxID=347529 RepID=A0AA38WC27_9ASTR|nr:hypothetical protein OSB04_010536 [Centaurea solstitialis]